MYNYSGYQTALATLMVTSTADPNFQNILPNCIDYAEQRIYREIDLLNTRYTDTSSACVAGTDTAFLTNTLMVLELVSVITPAGSTYASGGSKQSLIPVTRDFLDMVYPSKATASQSAPVYFAMIGQQAIKLGPCPDQNYNLEIFGTYRPAPLSATNATTPLTVLLSASMIFMAGYQKNFGAQADDPKMASSWEAQYEKQMAGAQSEEFRKKFQESSWSSQITPSKVDKGRD
jgi:hypothetical protein